MVLDLKKRDQIAVKSYINSQYSSNIFYSDSNNYSTFSGYLIAKYIDLKFSWFIYILIRGRLRCMLLQKKTKKKLFGFGKLSIWPYTKFVTIT